MWKWSTCKHYGRNLLNTISTAEAHNMFCPFTNGNCNAECIFNNNVYEKGNSENCNLMDAVRNIQSDGFVERTPKDYLESIEILLKKIELNTSSDQTESYSIKSELEDIYSKLNDIMKKI